MIDWATIVEQHGPDVWRTAYRLLSNREDASDCYQETFLQAVAYSRRREVTTWASMLKRIVTARALDKLRRRYRGAGRCEPLGETREPAERSPGPESRADLRESMGLVRQALTEIPPAQAEAFWLSEIEMLSHADIAVQLRSTPGHVAVLLHRAKQKLQKLLARHWAANEVNP